MNQNSSSTVIANELKKLFRFSLMGLIFGLLSFPIFYFEVYKANELEDGRMPSYTQLQYVYHDPGGLSTGSIYDSQESRERSRQILIRNSIKMIKEYILKHSIIGSLYTWLISIGVLVIIRYIYIGISWVNKNATK